MNTLWWLSLYSYVHSCASSLSEKLLETYSILVTAFQKKSYLLLEGISAPYEHSAVLTGVSASAVPVWHYLKEAKAFIAWSAGQRLEHAENYVMGGKNLSILSMAIMDDTTQLYDLTDFIAGITVYHAGGLQPSVAHILAAWSLHSKIVLSASHAYLAHMITDTAESIAVPIDSQESLDTLVSPEGAEESQVD